MSVEILKDLKTKSELLSDLKGEDYADKFLASLGDVSGFVELSHGVLMDDELLGSDLVQDGGAA